MPDKSTTPVQANAASLRALVAEIERLRARHDEEADDNATHLREAEGERDAAVKRAEEAERLAATFLDAQLGRLQLALVQSNRRLESHGNPLEAA